MAAVIHRLRSAVATRSRRAPKAPPDEAPAQASPARLKTGVATAVHKLRTAIGASSRKEAEGPEQVALEDEGTVHEAMALPARLARAGRNLLEEVTLRRRRRLLTVTVDNNIIRGVVFEGQEVVAWGIADPQDGAPFMDGPDQAEEDFDAARIGTMLQALRGPQALMVTDLPVYVPLIRHLKLPQVGKRYIRAVVESEVATSIPFGEDEVDIKWQRVENPADESEGEKEEGEEGQEPEGPTMQIMAVSGQKGEIDSHIDLYKRAGLGPTVTYSQAAALGRAAGVPDAMVVHMLPQQASVILVRGQVSQSVYQIVTPEGEQTPKELAESVARAVEQMEGYDLTIDGSQEGEPLPLVLTGEVPSDGVLAGELQQVLQRNVLPPSPPIVAPEGLPIEEFATNVGLAILAGAGAKSGRKEHELDATSPNLLSARHIPPPFPLVAASVFAGLALFALVSIFGLTNWANSTSAEVSETEKAAQDLREALQQYDIDLNPFKKLQKDARAFRQETLKLKNGAEALSQEMATLGAWFDRIEEITVTSRPPSVSVSDLKFLGDDFKLFGTAPTLEDAIKYAENIRSSGLFVEVRLREVGSSLGLSTRSAPTLEDILAGAGALAAPEEPAESETSGLSFEIEASVEPPPEEETGAEGASE